jgi:hypothetical protein
MSERNMKRTEALPHAQPRYCAARVAAHALEGAVGRPRLWFVSRAMQARSSSICPTALPQPVRPVSRSVQLAQCSASRVGREAAEEGRDRGWRSSRRRSEE